MFAGWRDVTPPHACGYGGLSTPAASSAAAHGARTRAQSEFAPPDRNELVHQLGGAGGAGQRRAAERAARDGEGSEWYVPPPLGGEQPHVRYAVAFASRSPRLSTLAAYRHGISYNGHFTGNDFDRAMVQPSYRDESAVAIHDPGRASAAFKSSPRVRQPATAKAALRSKVLEGLPAWERHAAVRRGPPPRRPMVMPPVASPRRLPALQSPWADPPRRPPPLAAAAPPPPPPPPAAQVVPISPTLHGEWDVGSRVRDGSPALPPRPALGSAGAEVALGRVVRPYCS